MSARNRISLDELRLEFHEALAFLQHIPFSILFFTLTKLNLTKIELLLRFTKLDSLKPLIDSISDINVIPTCMPITGSDSEYRTNFRLEADKFASEYKVIQCF